MGTGLLPADSTKPVPTVSESVETRPVPLIPVSVRLDIWLDVACLFKTRSEAQRACKGGEIDVNGRSARPHRELHASDIIEITRPLGRRQRVVVRAVAEKHIPKAEARLLYGEPTPPPSPEEQVLLDLMRLAGPRRRPGPIRVPDRREKRRLRAAK